MISYIHTSIVPAPHQTDCHKGGSVAHTFLTDPNLRRTYRIRGLSRDPSSPACQSLLSRGVEEIVHADLHNPKTLAAAFSNASVIFSITDFWHPFHNPANQAQAAALNKTIGEYAYELEYAQGLNIALSASEVPTLDRLIVSALNSPKKWSQGKYNHLYHFESKADMITYIKTSLPSLAAKTSILNMGVFYTSWQFVSLTAPNQLSPGHHKMTLPCSPTTSIPLVDARKDTGPFVRALLQIPPGVNLLGETSLVSWTEYMRVWGKLLGVAKSEYEDVSDESYDEAIPGGFGKELADMFRYMGDVGYDGGDPESVRKEDLGVHIPDLTSLESYIREADWMSVGIPRERDPTKDASV